MLLEELKKYNIILLSQSSRRHFLLKGLDINFKTKKHNFPFENYPEGLNKEEIACYLAKQKVKSYDLNDKNTILIAADTIVYLDNEILTKPCDYNQAYEILKKLSGRMNRVITGVCLRSIYRQKCFYSFTDVYFKNLSHSEIKYYIEKYKPYDKAGSYGIQEWIGYIGIEKIEGSFYNVMGLPVEKLYEELKNFIK